MTGGAEPAVASAVVGFLLRELAVHAADTGGLAPRERRFVAAVRASAM